MIRNTKDVENDDGNDDNYDNENDSVCATKSIVSANCLREEIPHTSKECQAAVGCYEHYNERSSCMAASYVEEVTTRSCGC